MNNVLDHVRDADACLERATELLRPGGNFVFGQDLSNEEDIAQPPVRHRPPDPADAARTSTAPRRLETLLRKDLSREAAASRGCTTGR